MLSSAIGMDHSAGYVERYVKERALRLCEHSLRQVYEGLHPSLGRGETF